MYVTSYLSIYNNIRSTSINMYRVVCGRRNQQWLPWPNEFQWLSGGKGLGTWKHIKTEKRYNERFQQNIKLKTQNETTNFPNCIESNQEPRAVAGGETSQTKTNRRRRRQWHWIRSDRHKDGQWVMGSYIILWLGFFILCVWTGCVHRMEDGIVER